MTPRKRSNIQQVTEISFDALTEPRTIPSGWDVAAFYAPEQDSQNSYGMMRDFNTPSNTASMPNDNTPDSV